MRCAGVGSLGWTPLHMRLSRRESPAAVGDLRCVLATSQLPLFQACNTAWRSHLGWAHGTGLLLEACPPGHLLHVNSVHLMHHQQHAHLQGRATGLATHEGEMAHKRPSTASVLHHCIRCAQPSP
jgi:hypothetical protein